MEQRDYNIRFHGVDIIEKCLYKLSVTEEDVFFFEVKSQSLVDSAQKLIVTFVEVNIKKANSSEIIAAIICGFGYVVENFENSLEKNEESNYIIPSELEKMLRDVSISTMRGIMFSEFRGTQLHKAILPLIKSDSFMLAENDIINIK